MYVLSRHFCYCPGTVRDKCFLFISVYVYISAFIVISPPLYLIPSSLCVSTQASIVRDGDHYVINGRKWSARLFTERVLCLHFTSLFLPCWKNLLITPLSLVHLFLSFFLSFSLWPLPISQVDFRRYGSALPYGHLHGKDFHRWAVA